MQVEDPYIDISNIDTGKTWVQKELVPSFSDKQLVLLNGDMGAGKTQIVKFILEELTQGKDEVASPTFALHNEYEVGSRLVDHIDLYRLENEEDLESSGFWDVFSKDEGLILIEWASKIDTSHYPMDWDLIIINIDVRENIREMRYSGI